jgi:hypothetical protein
MEPTTPLVGNPATDSNGSPATVVLPASNSSDMTIDFGFRWPASTTPLDIKCDCTSGKTGQEYSFNVKGTGGTPKYTYSIAYGKLPDGLTLNSATGAISGTPTKAGTFQFVVKVTDSAGKTDTAQCTIVIYPSGVKLQCPTATGKVNTAYSSRLTATNGTSPYLYAIVSGSLPKGLSLNASTGAIYGTPSMAGTWTFTAKVKDAADDTAVLSCSIKIDAPYSGYPCIGKKDYWFANAGSWPSKSVTMGSLKFNGATQSMVIGGKQYTKGQILQLLDLDDDENISVETAGQLATNLLNASVGQETSILKQFLLATIDRLLNDSDPLCFGDRCVVIPDSVKAQLRKYLDSLD